MDVKSDGVDCFILPDGAKCKLTGQSPLDMEECPCLHEYCDGDCAYYTEEDSFVCGVSVTKDKEYYVISKRQGFGRNCKVVGCCKIGECIASFLKYDFTELRERLKNGSLSDLVSSILLRNDTIIDELFLFPLYARILSGGVDQTIINLVIDEYEKVRNMVEGYFDNVFCRPLELPLVDAYEIYSDAGHELSCRCCFKLARFSRCDKNAFEWQLTNSMYDLMVYLMQRYLYRNIHFDTCKLCKRPYALVKKNRTFFCPYCKRDGRLKPRSKWLFSNDIEHFYLTHYSKVLYMKKTGIIEPSQFEQWSIETRKYRDECRAGNITLDELKELVETSVRLLKGENNKK